MDALSVWLWMLSWCCCGALRDLKVLPVCRCGAVQCSLNVCSPRRARRDCVMRMRVKERAVAVVPTNYARSKLQRCNSQRCTPASGSIPSSSQFSAKSAWLTIAYECRPIPAVSKVKCVSINWVFCRFGRGAFATSPLAHPQTCNHCFPQTFILHTHTLAHARARTHNVYTQYTDHRGNRRAIKLALPPRCSQRSE